MPSTTYKGFEFENEPVPRTRTVGPAPGTPLFTTFTPATLPCIAAIGDDEGVLSNCSPFTTTIGLVRSFTLAEP